FSENYGIITSSPSFVNKYTQKSIGKLKFDLKALKLDKSGNNSDEIIYLSKLIRSMIKKGQKVNQISESHFTEKEFKESFWSSCKKIFNKAVNIAPTFSLLDCYNYFKTTLCGTDQSLFNIPSWFVQISPPTTCANTSPPTYAEIARLINRAKSSSSPCPLDQISVIMFKKCPILRSVLHKLLSECWRVKYTPHQWRRGVSVLIYKKGDAGEVGNFRPITLQPILYKIYSSFVRNRLQLFLNENNLINTNIQKGFVSNCDGVVEHTELLSFVMNDAKRHQRNLFLALFDLRNAFGEVNHNLIRSSLYYHHIPSSFIEIFDSIYNNFNVSVACNGKLTDAIPVEKGVLQGDPLSPLLFNLCFDSLVKILDTPNYRKLGYIWGKKCTQTCNWLQYADDATLISRDQKGAQGLTNLFDAWCSWAKMDIRLDKCSTFGMVKKNTKQIQILPTLSIKVGKIPAVPLGEDFKYLGKIFNFNMNNETGKKEIVEKLEKMLKILSELHISPQTRLKILDRFVPSQLSFLFKIYDIPNTWITEKLDSLCTRYIRKWLEAPISSCINEWLVMPENKCGVGIPSFKHIYERQRLSKRSSLKCSQNENIKDLWQETSMKNININPDSMLLRYPVKQAKKITRKSRQKEAEDHLIALGYQGAITKIVIETISSNYISDWTKTLTNLPGFLYNFTRKAMQQQLPTLSNLVRWGKAVNNQCPLCSLPQTNKHVLSNCSNAHVLERFTSRHDKILEIIANWFKSKIPKDVDMFADLKNANFKQCSDLFIGVRPDLVFVKGNIVQALELTVCHETNLISSKNYKLDKYKSLAKHKSSIIEHHDVKINTCEVTVLGFLSMDNDVLNFLNIDKCDT
ncbi:MAG: reverse transcriptase domain-containing protein, partial [Nitrososphaeraceae archaeon]|nr:reverse transcriptase domain-containing protein [Nitrososphaeraceae archaeon]